MLEKNDLQIESFCPNCLMGATGAIAKYKYNIENVNKLFFHHSYVYQKEGDVLYNSVTGGINVWFSRELPVSKEEFCERLYEYYGICHYTADYYNFQKFLEDVTLAILRNEPVILEIDFYYMKRHDFYMKVHDQHVMILYDIKHDEKCFKISEAVFGFSEMSFSEYKEYFYDVVNNRKRAIHILCVKSNCSCKSINIKYFIKDLEKSISNLSDTNDKGISSLQKFSSDFIEFINYESEMDRVYIPGSWTFMCDTMNCIKFIKEFSVDYPDLCIDSLQRLKKEFTLLYRKWFAIIMGIKEINENAHIIKEALSSIIKIENDLIKDMKILRDELKSLNSVI